MIDRNQRISGNIFMEGSVHIPHGHMQKRYKSMRGQTLALKFFDDMHWGYTHARAWKMTHSSRMLLLAASHIVYTPRAFMSVWMNLHNKSNNIYSSSHLYILLLPRFHLFIDDKLTLRYEARHCTNPNQFRQTIDGIRRSAAKRNILCQQNIEQRLTEGLCLHTNSRRTC